MTGEAVIREVATAGLLLASYPLDLLARLLEEPVAAVRLGDLLTRAREIGVEPPNPEALELADPTGAAAARGEPLLDALDRLEGPPGAPAAAPPGPTAGPRGARPGLG